MPVVATRQVLQATKTAGGCSQAHQQLRRRRFAAALQACEDMSAALGARRGQPRLPAVPAEPAGCARGSARGAAPVSLRGCTPKPPSGAFGDLYSATASAIQAPHMPNTTASSVTHCASVQAAAGACRYSAATPPTGCASWLSQPSCSSHGCSCASEAAPAGAAKRTSLAAGAPSTKRLALLRPMTCCAARRLRAQTHRAQSQTTERSEHS